MRIFWLYLAVWVFPLSSAMWFASGYNIGLSELSQAYMFGLIGMMFVLSLLTSIIFRKIPPSKVISARFNEPRAIKFHLKCIQLWFCIFILEVIVSGGAPIVWSVERGGYGDFGIPVLHGFSNMLRGMILAHLVLFKCLDFKLNKCLIILSILPLLGALFIEQSRGAFVMTICFALGPALLFLNYSIGRILKTLIIIPLVIVTLSAFQFFRYSDSMVEELGVIARYVVDSDSFAEMLLEPALNYIAIPALNAGLNIDSAPLYILAPNETIKPIVPTVLRGLFWDMSFEKDDWGLLVNEAFNTSTFITPFVRDFGLIGAGIFFGCFFFMCVYVYHRARCGSVLNIIRLPPLVMCIALSFFTSYLSSLVTILYLLLAGPVSRRMMCVRLQTNGTDLTSD